MIYRNALLFVLAICTAQVCWAQSPQRPSDDELNARIQALSEQRNAAQDQVVVISASAQTKLRELQTEIEKLKKEAASCKPEVKKDDKK